MAKTIRTKVYSFGELSSEAKEVALSKYRQINVEYDDWYEFIFEDIKEDLKAKGYIDIDISFSGFYSQGDGASFTGYVDVNKWIEANEPQKYKRIKDLYFTANIKRDRWHGYVHWNTTSVYLEADIAHKNVPNIEALVDTLEADILQHHQQLNRNIYKRLESCFDDLCSDISVADTLEANDYLFTKDGKVFNY